MTTLNWSTSPDRALVITDTATITTRGSTRTEASKLHCVAHANMIIAGRGNLMFCRIIYDILQQLGVAFDEVVRSQLPQILKFGYGQLCAVATQCGYAELISSTGQQILFIGWSDERAEFSAVIGHVSASDGAVSVEDQPNGIAPWHSTWGPHPRAPANADEMVQLATRQIERAEDDFPDATFGGRLVLADLTRNAAMIRTIELYSQTVM